MNTRDPDTYLRGEACYQAKLKEADVIAMRKLVKDGIKVTYIAEKLGINRKTLGDAINGRTWKHLARAITLVLATTTATHAETRHAFGAGAVDTCFDYLYHGTKDEDFEWTLAFLSGASSYAFGEVNIAVSGMGANRVPALETWMTKYCSSNLPSHIIDAANELFATLATAAGYTKGNSYLTQ